jgi:tetratricopeptide (TPR) repeat protein
MMSEHHDVAADLDETLEEAARLSDSGDAAAALALLLEEEARYPDDPMLLCMIGALAETLGAEGMSVDFFQRCLAQNPTDVEVLILAGSGLAAAGDPGAEPALRLAALTSPDHPLARMHYGVLLVRTGLLEQGLEELSAARSLDPSSARTRRELGVAHLLRGAAEDALEELEAAVAADADDVENRLMLGLALVQEGQLSRAAEELHSLGEMLPDDGEVQLLLALLFALEGWEEEAWLAVSRAESAEPPVDSALVREVEEAIGSGQEAQRDLLIEELAPTSLRERLFLA